MNVLLWHHHGSWTTAFVQGPHRYLLPVEPGRGPDGRGRARTWDWPAAAVEVPLGRIGDEPVDCVIVQRSRDLELARAAGLGDVPVLWLEHDTPPTPATSRHPAADLPGVGVVHVTAFNALSWDNGEADVHVVEHGVVDPGARWTGELPRVAVVTNEPVRRGRLVGADLVRGLVDAGLDVDVFGMGVTGLAGHLGVDPARLVTHEDLPQAAMHRELARRRVYAHLTRWTSLGLSLVEAMTLGMPVVALATTAAPDAVAPGAGVVDADPRVLARAAAAYVADHGRAAAAGRAARAGALERFSLHRFLSDWDRILKEVTA